MHVVDSYIVVGTLAHAVTLSSPQSLTDSSGFTIGTIGAAQSGNSITLYTMLSRMKCLFIATTYEPANLVAG